MERNKYELQREVLARKYEPLKINAPLRRKVDNVIKTP